MGHRVLLVTGTRAWKALTDIRCAPSLESDVDRVELFRLTLRSFDGVVIYFLFRFRLQIFRRRVGIFSHFFICCFFLYKD